MQVFSTPGISKMPGTNIDHAEENAEVEVLLSQATKQAEIGKKISAAVNKIQDSTNRLQDLVGPAYNDTQVLQVMNKSKQSQLVHSQSQIANSDHRHR